VLDGLLYWFFCESRTIFKNYNSHFLNFDFVKALFFVIGAWKSVVRPKIYWQFTKNWKSAERTMFTYFRGGIIPLVASAHISPPIKPRNGNKILHCSLYQIHQYPGMIYLSIYYIAHSKSTLQTASFLLKIPPTKCPSRCEDIARLNLKVEVTNWYVQILNASTVVIIWYYSGTVRMK